MKTFSTIPVKIPVEIWGQGRFIALKINGF